MQIGREITDAERSVLATFARHMRLAHRSVMPASEILGDAQGPGREALRSAIRSLADRGWLVAATTVHLEDHHQCALFGEGLRLAQLMAADNPAAKAEGAS